MEPGELLTRWTVRVAVTLYVVALALRVGASATQLWWARLAWTLGCIAYLLHVACAFQFYHHWSHAAAYEATARRTAEDIGLEWGGGLYANYAFTLVWVIDVCWWWAAPRHYRSRPRWVEWSIQGFLAFILLNATVVFGAGAVRWLGAAACLFLAGLFVRGRR